MFAPKPPQPVGRRRAVAEMIVAHKQQAATIASGHVFVVAAPVVAEPLPTIAAPSPDVSPFDDDTPI